jgi:hypothetical protein
MRLQLPMPTSLTLPKQPAIPLRKIREELSRRNRERLRQLYDVFQGDIPLPAFHTAHVVAMQPSPFRQFLLRIATFVTEFA